MPGKGNALCALYRHHDFLGRLELLVDEVRLHALRQKQVASEPPEVALNPEVPLMLRKEIYATAGAAGALTYIALILSGVAPVWAQLAGFTAAFAIRAVGIAFGVSLPVYKPRPGRDY